MGGRLDGKVAIITGGAGGIGLATAKLFCREGARVSLFDLDQAALDAAAAQAGIEQALPLRVDITSDEQVLAAVDRTAAHFGKLDVLVNCAAVREYHALADAPAESWARIIQVNMLGTAACSRAAIPHLRRAGSGSVVNVSSVYGVVGRQGMGQYDATKAAILAMTRVLAAEEAAHGIRANAICPGSVLTPFTLGRAKVRSMTEEELRARGAAPSLLGRWAEPEEIAYPILWLASDEASFVTGAVLMIDGGLSAI